MRGAEIPHPDRWRSGSTAETQELEIAARDHGGAVTEEVSHGVAERRGLPLLLGDPIDAEQNLGDFALAGAMPAGVDGAQHRLEPSSLLGRHALVAWNPVACQVPQQAVGGGKAVETVRVDRYRDRQRIVGLDRGVGDQMQAGTDLAQQEVEFLRRDPHLA